MRKDKEQAVVFRQSGMSYSDIKAHMGVPKSTLSQWFHDQKWSNDIAIETAKRARNSAAIRLMVLNTVRGGRLKKVYEDARQDAFVDFSELKYHPLFIAGIMLYASHGDKTSKHRISLSSMDEKTVHIFKLFLERICSITNLRAQLYLSHDFSREEEIRAHWIETCRFQAKNFIRTVHLKHKASKKLGNKPYFGVCNLIVNSAYLKNKILRWVELMNEEIGEEKYLAGIV
jgi:hypothetical protein